MSASMDRHFSEVAGAYNALRTTDIEPILLIRDTLGRRGSVRGIDVACGGGRYSQLLLEHVPGLALTLHDQNDAMLSEATRYLAEHGIEDVPTVEGDIADLEFPDAAFDAVFTFNAIHHFDPSMFLAKAARALSGDGRVFIYTRLREQNARSVWGQLFPSFAEREDRLYELAEVESWDGGSGSLGKPEIVQFEFQRRATLSELIHQARSRHYSTFSLYSPAELEQALAEFERAVRERFPDVDAIEWTDENVMIVYGSAAR
ncbi:MAG: class I SAM-dependent methyltransferase [Chloroflexi bacterium]|nr:class I SAM-dependent methyltransferase [Chloroflexota bacterium]